MKSHYTNLQRRNDLAKIHIAAKALMLEDGEYRALVRKVSGNKSSSAADLDYRERWALLKELKALGWKPQEPKKKVEKVDESKSKCVWLLRVYWRKAGVAGLIHDLSETHLLNFVAACSGRPRKDTEASLLSFSHQEIVFACQRLKYKLRMLGY